MKRLITILLTLTLSLSGIRAQQESAASALMRYAGNIHQFNSIFPQEKVYLQFDNTSYYTGDAIWFKAFVVNATTLQRAQSKVLYVDLVSPTGVVLKQQKLKIVGGQADGMLSLIDGSTAQARELRGALEYPSGFYEVRAYTNYMLNFSQESIYSRVFAVYEKPKTEGNYYAEQPVVRLHKAEVSDPRPKTENLRRINCTFYPEGGHLIDGKATRIAFKVTDDSGLGIPAECRIDDSGTAIRTIHDGMGSFIYTPGSRRGSVTIIVDGKSHSFSLPQAEETGLALAVTQNGKDSITIKVDCTPELAGKTLGMALTCRGDIVDFCTVETGSGQTQIQRTLSGIPEGVCRINLFDEDGRLYASRAIYHRSQALRTPQLEVTSSKDRYEPFEKINLQFHLKDGQGNPFRDRFCLSVRDARGQGSPLADDLRTSLLLSSDLKGYIENPSWYFETTPDESDPALDLLMLVQGWERYDWQTMTGQKEFRERHRVEETLTLNGWVMNSSGKKPVEGIEVLAALMPADKRLSETYTYKTDSTGYFGFDIGAEFYDKARFTIDAHVAKERLIGPSARIVFDRSMTPSIRAYQPQELVFNSNSIIESRKKSKAQDDDLPTLINENIGLLLPDVEIDEDRMYVDYFTFKAYDVVKDVEVDLDKGEYSTDLWSYLLDKGYDVVRIVKFTEGNDPVEIIITTINGFTPFFYVHDSQKYKYAGIFEEPLNIDSRDIKSIMVYDRPVYAGDIPRLCPLFVDSPIYMESADSLIGNYEGRNFLVDILVKEPSELSTNDELFKINKRITTVDGYSRQYEFYAPEYPNGPVLGDVDYRRTLYWNPNVITDNDGNANVEFYNNSVTRNFKMSAAGITPGGIPYIFDTDF